MWELSSHHYNHHHHHHHDDNDYRKAPVEYFYKKEFSFHEEEKEEKENDDDIIPIRGVVLNALNLISGASLVGLPYALKQSGLVIGILLFILLSYYADITHQLLVECSKFHPILHKYPIHSYEDLVSLPFGKIGEYILMFSIFVVSLGGTVGYLIMIKDALPMIFDSNQRKIILVLIWMFFIIPLTFLKNVKSLEYVSGLSVLLTLVLITVIIHQCPFQESIDIQGGLLPLIQEYGFRPNIFATISIFIDAITWQHGSFIVFHSLKYPTLSRWRCVTVTVHSVACILYACVAIPGYIGYLDNTQGTIFLNLPNNIVSNIARLFFSLIIVMIYPIDMLIARDLMLSLIRRNETVEHTESKQATVSLNTYHWRQYFICGREILIVMTLNIAVLTIALMLGDLGKVLTYTGAIGGSITCFIVPGAVYIGVNGAELLTFTRTQAPSAGDSVNDQMHVQNLSCQMKPWWFGILGFPIWCSLARIGMENIQRKIMVYPFPIVDTTKISDGRNVCLTEGSDFTFRLSPKDEINIVGTQTLDTVVQPTSGRLVTSMILVTFGVVNMIVVLVQAGTN